MISAKKMLEMKNSSTSPYNKVLNKLVQDIDEAINGSKKNIKKYQGMDIFVLSYAHIVLGGEEPCKLTQLKEDLLNGSFRKEINDLLNSEEYKKLTTRFKK